MSENLNVLVWLSSEIFTRMHRRGESITIIVGGSAAGLWKMDVLLEFEIQAASGPITVSKRTIFGGCFKGG